MNFPEVGSMTEAEILAPEPPLCSEGDAWRYRQGQRRIDITKADERFMAHWCRDHPKDVATVRAFWKEK
jgi:hypothetical protein